MSKHKYGSRAIIHSLSRWNATGQIDSREIIVLSYDGDGFYEVAYNLHEKRPNLQGFLGRGIIGFAHESTFKVTHVPTTRKGAKHYANN